MSVDKKVDKKEDNKIDTDKAVPIIRDHFTRPLEFTTISEVKKYLKHNPFSYYDPPTEDKPWNIISITSYKEISVLKRIIDDCIKTGSFMVLDPPKAIKSIIDILTKRRKTIIEDIDKSKSNKKTPPEIPTIYFVKMFGEMNALLALKPSKSKIYKKIIISISMCDNDLYMYYKYVFILANIFGIRF
jgi:hypothetical protein